MCVRNCCSYICRILFLVHRQIVFVVSCKLPQETRILGTVLPERRRKERTKRSQTSSHEIFAIVQQNFTGHLHQLENNKMKSRITVSYASTSKFYLGVCNLCSTLIIKFNDSIQIDTRQHEKRQLLQMCSTAKNGTSFQLKKKCLPLPCKAHDNLNLNPVNQSNKAYFRWINCHTQQILTSIATPTPVFDIH